MRVDVELEFYVRVQPSVEGIATAAQAIGAKSFTPDGIRNLLEGRFIDALQAVAARHTMDGLHEKRAEFVASISELLRDNLEQNGMLLDSVSLTRLDQAAFSALRREQRLQRRRDAQAGRDHRRQPARSAPRSRPTPTIAVRQTQLEATKRGLARCSRRKQAQINQHLEIEKMKAASDAETAKARERLDDRLARTRASSASARPRRWSSPSSASCARSRSRSQLELGAAARSTARSGSPPSTSKRRKRRPQAELARTEVVLAQEHVQTERERAVADRSREMAVKRVQRAGRGRAAPRPRPRPMC